MTDPTPTVAQAPKPRPKSGRRRAREFALQGVYQWLLSSAEPGEVHAHIADTPGFDKSDRAHFDALLHGVIRDAETLRATFAPFIDRPAQELSPVEHGVLLLGTYELMHQVEVPYRVVINEAVELAKAFGGTDGFKYVNGVLDKVAGAVRPAEVEARRAR